MGCNGSPAGCVCLELKQMPCLGTKKEQQLEITHFPGLPISATEPQAYHSASLCAVPTRRPCGQRREQKQGRSLLSGSPGAVSSRTWKVTCQVPCSCLNENSPVGILTKRVGARFWLYHPDSGTTRPATLAAKGNFL